MTSKPATMTVVRCLGEPVRLSADLVLTVVGVEGRRVRLKLSAAHGTLVNSPVLMNPSSRRLSVPVGTSLEVAERALVEATVKACGGAKPRAAAILGCSLKTLYTKLHRYAEADGHPGGKTTGALRPGRGTGLRMEQEGPVEVEP